MQSWLRTKNTIEFLGFWEQLNNINFKVHEFVYFKNSAGSNSFNPSIIEWIEKTNSTGIVAKRGRYGGTYAHKDIAFEFGTWLSPEFKLLIITEFQRLKAREQQTIGWDSHGGKNQRDYATIQQLVILANLENLNAHFISEGMNQKERVLKLIESAERQYKSLLKGEEVGEVLALE